MFLFTFPATFRSDEHGRPVVTFPDFPGAITDGRDELEAMQEAIDLLGG
jgi:predicted RNase H-like HicB family nuclease